jgi:tRNA-Thr(GGU) m(6)t(6)A37 methyltransferase TsaA
MERIFEFRPIGVVHCRRQYRFEAPRQGIFSSGNGEIEIFAPYSGDAIADLAGFERIWVIFCFHVNRDHQWKAKVRPPYPAGGPCRSVFATRSPHRVNPIGMSCVELAGISGRRLLVRHIDMLDGTPVLDIKPYIPEADSFPDSAVGWRSSVPQADEFQWSIEFADLFLKQAEFIFSLSSLDLVNLVKVQLGNEPLDSSRKRIRQIENSIYALGCRTWQIIFSVNSAGKKINIMEICSNYAVEELAEGADDRYADKDVHRKFIRQTF